GRLSHGASALVVGEQRVFVQTTRSRRSDESARLACLDRETGRLLWQKSEPELRGELRLYSKGVSKGIVVCCDSYRVYPKRIYVRSAVDGRLLWTSPPMNEGKSVGVYAIDGLIWCQHNRQTIGLDAATGKIKRKHVAAPGTFKCSHPAATTRYMPGGSLAFLDLSTGKIEACKLDRNGCGSDPGVLFCNGLTYSFPKQCSCFSMIRGYTAYTADQPLDESTRDGVGSNRLVKGPAFEDRVFDQQDSAGWPAFRHDGRRSANTNSSVPLPIKKLWEAAPENQQTPKWLEEDWRNHPSLDGPVSSVVAGDGMLCVSLPNSHKVAALDPRTGRLRWSFTAGGRVLTPPTISGGLCFFGGQDGWAYCLRLKDGGLAWKFRAAPADRRILAHGQLESLWPVSGGVLVENGRAYFTAGRLSNLVGGLVGYAVDARTGKLIWKQTPPTGYEYTTENKIAPAYRNDVPVGGGNVVQMGHPRWIVSAQTGEFAKDVVPVRHRYVKPKPVPILSSTRDGLWDLSRSKWQGPTNMNHGYLAQEFGDVWAQQLVVRDNRIFGFQLPTIKTYNYDKKHTQKRNPLRLVAWDRSFKELWSKPLAEGTEFVGMIGAGEVLFATGTQRLKARPYFKGMLWAYSIADGSELARFELGGLPAGEGLAAAYGKLYVTMQDGRILCLANDKR
ncbi:MAG: PQQ-binding-like beta-propeller repeat protein, partial [Gammaproteobacteria bacterium]|nr:PQQ-binding-like beta-propeller repeat protein [Gammaproteobacteria bacterium]